MNYITHVPQLERQSIMCMCASASEYVIQCVDEWKKEPEWMSRFSVTFVFAIVSNSFSISVSISHAFSTSHRNWDWEPVTICNETVSLWVRAQVLFYDFIFVVEVFFSRSWFASCSVLTLWSLVCRMVTNDFDSISSYSLGIFVYISSYFLFHLSLDTESSFIHIWFSFFAGSFCLRILLLWYVR